MLGAGAVSVIQQSRPPDPRESLAPARAALIEARGTLEVAGVEYEESVEGTEVVRRPEYEGARSALDRSRRSYRRARPALGQIAAASAAKIDRSYEKVDEMMAAPDPPERVTAAIDELIGLLEQATG
jgi:hypothetical protein